MRSSIKIGKEEEEDGQQHQKNESCLQHKANEKKERKGDILEL